MVLENKIVLFLPLLVSSVRYYSQDFGNPYICQDTCIQYDNFCDKFEKKCLEEEQQCAQPRISCKEVCVQEAEECVEFEEGCQSEGCATELTECAQLGEKKCIRYAIHPESIKQVPAADDIECIESVQTCLNFTTTCVVPAPCPIEDCVRIETVCAQKQVECSQVCAKFKNVCINEVNDCKSERSVCTQKKKICRQRP